MRVYEITLLTGTLLFAMVLLLLVSCTLLNFPPQAEFSWDPQEAISDSPINFFDLSRDPDGVINRWFWDFGDGQTDTSSAPTHTYSSPGLYDVKLTVTDNRGASSSITKTVPVDPSPRGSFLILEPRIHGDRMKVAFFSMFFSCPTPECSFVWDFGDGQVVSDRYMFAISVEHEYPSWGPYEVKFAVVDGKGRTARPRVKVVSGQPIPSDAIMITEAVHEPIKVPLEATIMVRLKGNPFSTGYLWEYKPSPSLEAIKPIGEYFYTPTFTAPPPPGGGWGIFQFVFRAVKRGTYTLDFIHWRPWTKMPSGSDFSVTVIVE